MGNKCCKKKNKEINPGAVLDRVISQSDNEDDCLLYKLANYKKAGELIDAYNIGGALEVEKLIREQFSILMYKDGKGQIVTRTEYLRWKFRNQKHVVIPVVASGPNDPLAKWEDHLSCWQMQYRGSLGESLLHLLIICDTKMHTRLARILLKCYPQTAWDIVEGEEYYGVSALHLAIAYNNTEMVHLVVGCGAAIEGRATGSFFLPRDQQMTIPAEETDYDGLAYLGEYPLAWAACMNNESVYNLLLDKGADPDKQDSFGNMILHMVVITDQLGMFGYALRHPHIVATADIENDLGLSPLTLACQLGRADVFKEMLELSAREFWRYSNITCSGYPLNALDTIMPDGRTNWNSALFMILEGSKEDHLNMLEGGIIQRLLEEKWKTFAQNQFLKRISIAVLHLFCMSISIYLRPFDRTIPLLEYRSPIDGVRLFFEAFTIVGTLSYLFVQQAEEIKNQGFINYCKKLPQSPPKAIFLIGNFFLLAIIPFRLSNDIGIEEKLLAICLVCSWFFMMFFAGAIQLTGPFVTMIYSMITGDMLTFGIIFGIFILGFSQAFFFLYKSYPGESIFGAFHSTWMALFQMTLGGYSYDDLSSLAYPNLAKTVFIVFMILVPILLLNMLIAMMGNTYSQVIERSEKEWVKQWAKLVVALERAVSQDDCKKYLEEYSIKLSGTTPENEVRGVMVIKSKDKTRASQRKGALTNWKRVGKVTINALKKRKMTGEELRQVMWGHRNSVSTPQQGPTPRTSLQQSGGLLMPGNGEISGSSVFDSTLDSLAFTGDLQQNGNGNLPMFFDENVPEVIQGQLIHSKPQVNLHLGGSVPSANGLTPVVSTSPGTSLITSTTTQSAIAERPLEHQIPPKSILKSPKRQTLSAKSKKRSNFGSIRPRIIIFSDKKDFGRVGLDTSDEEQDSEISDEENFSKNAPKKKKELTLAVDNLPTKISATPSGSIDSKEKEKSKGIVNPAYETTEVDDKSTKSKPQTSLEKETEKSSKQTSVERPKSGTPAAPGSSAGNKKQRGKSAASSKSLSKSVEIEETASVENAAPENLDRWGPQNIENMSKLVAWERPEDDEI